MPAIETENLSENWTLSTFQKTPKMSLYLVALSINDFSHVETNGPNNMKVRAKDALLFLRFLYTSLAR